MGCGSSTAAAGATLVAESPDKSPDSEPKPDALTEEKPNGDKPVVKETPPPSKSDDTTDCEQPSQQADQPASVETAVPSESTAATAVDVAEKSEEKPATVEDCEPPIPLFVEPPVAVKNVQIAEDWSAADAVAVDCPLTIRRTIKHLTDHFKSQNLAGLHLARAIFRWITCHIQWRAGGSQEPDSVLRKGGGEDAGFCALFSAMCSECGLNTKTVSGYVKDSGYVPATVPEEGATQQSWNLLEVEEGEFLVVDCLRAAGFTRNGTFEPLYCEFYWLPGPAEVLYSHYPTSATEAQACTRTYTLDEWAALPKVTDLYFKSNLQMPDGLRGIFETSDKGLLELKFTASPEMEYSSEIIKLSPKQKISQSYSYVNRDDASITLLSGYPNKGNFVLRLLAKQRGEGGALKIAAEFSVRCGEGRGTDPLNPVVVEHGREFQLIGPLLGELARDTSAYFHCKVKGASQVSVLVGEEIWPLQKISDNRATLEEELRKSLSAPTAEPAAPAETEPASPAEASAETEPTASEEAAEAAAPDEAPDEAEASAETTAPAETEPPAPVETEPATPAEAAAPAETEPTAPAEAAEAEAAAPAVTEPAAPEEAPAETEPAAPAEATAEAEAAAPAEAAEAEAAAPAVTEPAAPDEAPAETEPAAPAEAPAEAEAAAPAEAETPAPAEAETAAPAEAAAPDEAPAETAAPAEAPAEPEAVAEAPVETETATTAVAPAPAVAEEAVTSVWAGEVTVRGRDVYLAAYYQSDYTKLIRFQTKLI